MSVSDVYTHAMTNISHAAPLLARAGVQNPKWSGVIEVKRFDGLRDSSLEAALEQLAKHGTAALTLWEREPHPPTVEIHPDAIAVTDGRHRMLAALAAGIDEMPVRVREFDASGTAVSNYNTIAVLR